MIVRTRSCRFFVPVLAVGLSIEALAQPLSAQQDSSANVAQRVTAPSGVVQNVADQPAESPTPSLAVKKVLADEAHNSKAEPDESLRLADSALQAARERKDLPGEALAQETRAKALQKLERSDDAVAAWKEAARAWASAGEVILQIHALAQAAGSLNNGQAAGELFNQVLSLAKAENKCTPGLRQTLREAGTSAVAARQWEVGWKLLTTALIATDECAADSLELVETLNELGGAALRRSVGDSGEHDRLAREYFSRALALGQELVPDSMLVANSLYGLGQVEYSLDNFPGARENYLKALAIRDRLAPESLEVASALVELGAVARIQGDLKLALQYEQQALDIREKLVPGSNEVASSLRKIAAVEMEEGDLSFARETFMRALSIEEELHGDVISELIDLGALATEQYDFASARNFLERALQLLLKDRPSSGAVPMALGNLREMAFREGDWASALDYGRRAIAMFEKMSSGLDLADEYVGLGEVLYAQGKFAPAEQYYRQSLQMTERIAPGSLYVASSLIHLGRTARANGASTLASEYFKRALDIAERSAPSSPEMTEALHVLGELAYEQGDLLAAEKYQRRAVELRETTLGPAHPDLGSSLNDLALTVASSGRTAEALVLATRAEQIGREHLRLSARSLPERQALLYASTRVSSLGLLLTLAVEHPGEPSVTREVFDSLIRSRALVFDEMAARHRTVHGSEDAEVKRLNQQLVSARVQLSALIVRGIGDSSPEIYLRLLNDARNEKEDAERALAERSSAFRQEQTRSHLGLQEVAHSLPADAALVAFARYDRNNFARTTDGKADKPVPSYLAFVLPAGCTDPVVVPLGSAQEVETTVADWQKQITRQSVSAGFATRLDETVYRKTALALRRKVWDPIAAQIGSSERLFVIPDGALHLVNFSSLPIGQSEYLIERRLTIHYLSTERDLAPIEAQEQGTGLLALGSPAFNETRLFASLSPTGTNVASLSSVPPRSSPTRSACAAFRSLRFEPLPGSSQEIREIAALWSGRGSWRLRNAYHDSSTSTIVELEGPLASEAELKSQAPGKRVIHLATHAFFMGGRCASALDSADLNLANSITGDNPLLLSGLALAGANHRNAARADEEDGILSAEEIASLDLEGADWAVLSACDTGVGEVKTGEGVFGLRRAFQVAGVNTVIMSLWPVEDEMTRQWMRTLYREHFVNGKDTAESVRAASLSILRQRREKHLSTHPFHWAAFIAVGNS
jgi:CHAT domain-containing protein/Tfp pilus assembly protein PilF